MEHFLKREVPALCTAILALIAALTYAPHVYSQSTAEGSLEGWAWSETVGWISLQGLAYGLEAGSSGEVTGWAWSDNIGWMRPAEGGECPGAGAVLSGTQLSGWLKAIAADGSQAGGWDGCISLRGSGYGVNTSPNSSWNPSTSGAWGSDVVGWIAFDSSAEAVLLEPLEIPLTDPELLEDPPPPPSGCVSVSPLPECNPATSVRKGETARIYWAVENAEACLLNGLDAGVVSPDGGWETPPIEGQHRFTLSCAGFGGTFMQTAIVTVVPVPEEV